MDSKDHAILNRSQRAIIGWQTRRAREEASQGANNSVSAATKPKRNVRNATVPPPQPAKHGRTTKTKKSACSVLPAHIVAARSEDKFASRVESYGPAELLRLLNAGEAFKRRVALAEINDRLLVRFTASHIW